jgi:hypothetical protein
LHPPDFILQDALGVPECIIDRSARIGVTYIGVRFASDIDLLPVRKAEMDMDLEQASVSMMRSWTFHRDPTGDDSIKPLLERRDMPHHVLAQLVVTLNVLEVDLNLSFHQQCLT